MTEVDQKKLDVVRARYGHCFGCGPDNPIGLHVDEFAQEGNVVTARFRPRADYMGFHDILHGGIVATALDEILAWTAILVGGTMALTAKVEFKFRNAAPVDSDYTLEGILIDRRGRRLLIDGTCFAGGTVIAEASGLFLATDPIDSFV